MNSLRDFNLEPGELIQKTVPNYKKEAQPWWNLADSLEWVADGLEPIVMANIGDILKILPSRNEALDGCKLEHLKNNIEIITKQQVSTQMTQKIVRWFELNAVVSHTPSIDQNEPVTLNSRLRSCLPDVYTSYLSRFKQGSLVPHFEHPVISSLRQKQKLG